MPPSAEPPTLIVQLVALLFRCLFECEFVANNPLGWSAKIIDGRLDDQLGHVCTRMEIDQKPHRGCDILWLENGLASLRANWDRSCIKNRCVHLARINDGRANALRALFSTQTDS